MKKVLPYADYAPTPKSSWMWWVYFGLFVMYFMQGILYAEGSILSTAFGGLLIIFGGWEALRTFLRPRHLPAALWFIAALFVLLTIAFVTSPRYLFATALYDYIDTQSQYKGACAFFLSTFIGYRIGLKQQLSQKQILISAIIFAALNVLLFLKNAVTMQLERGTEENTNNSAYNFLFLLPFCAVLLDRYKLIAAALASAALVFVMAGAKRGAILCMALMILCFIVWYGRNYGISFKAVVLMTVLLVAGAWYVMYAFENNPYLQERLDSTMEGNSSARDMLYYDLWRRWTWEPDLQIKLFGLGTAQTVPIAGNFAHNDWLELLIDNGLVGALLYALIIISAAWTIVRSRISPYWKLCVMLWIVFWLAKSIFSMGYVSIFGGITMLFMGMALGNITAIKKLKRTNG